MILYLNNRSLIKITGEDSELFLQSQLTNDIKNIQDKKIQINAYCQHQGKVIAIIWVFKKEGDFYLSIPAEVKDIVLSKLNMFKLMSKVVIEDSSESLYQYGLINEKNEKSFQLSSNLALLISRKTLKTHDDDSLWEIACINENLPEVYLNMSEKHIPQALNLDINQIGVSFTKGCYPGQEVVARMHYLGQPKRRLFRFTSKFEVFIGDTLDVNNSKSLKSSGQVIRVVKKETEFHFLGVFEVCYINNKIFVNNNQKKLVNLIHE